MKILILLLWATSAAAGTIPNPAITPGQVRALTTAQVCTVTWGTDRRHVTAAMKHQVAAAYGVPWTQHQQYEFDHLIPRELGGADVAANLWPQRWASARQKDRLENRLHVLVCRGALSLRTAQREIAADWPAAYRQYLGEMHK